MGVQTECIAFARGTQGIQTEKFGRSVPDVCSGALFGLFPLATAELVQWRQLWRPAAITADDFELRDRYIQLVAAIVFEVKELGRTVTQIHGSQTGVAANPVLDVHHRIARLDLREVSEHVLGGDPSLAGAACSCLCREQLIFGDQCDFVFPINEAGMDFTDSDNQTSSKIFESLPVVDGGRA